MDTPHTLGSDVKIELPALGKDQTPEEQLEQFLVLIDREIRRAAAQGPLGYQKITNIAEIALDRKLRQDETLALRVGLRENTIDVDKLVNSLQKRSTATLSNVLDESIERNQQLFENRAEEYRREQIRSRTLNEQLRVVGHLNLAESLLPNRERTRLEDALADGRINPKTVERLMDRNQTAEIIDLAEELEEERSLQRSHGRSITRG
jgi:hypothetical protein